MEGPGTGMSGGEGVDLGRQRARQKALQLTCRVVEASEGEAVALQQAVVEGGRRRRPPHIQRCPSGSPAALHAHGGRRGRCGRRNELIKAARLLSISVCEKSRARRVEKTKKYSPSSSVLTTTGGDTGPAPWALYALTATAYCTHARKAVTTSRPPPPAPTPTTLKLYDSSFPRLEEEIPSLETAAEIQVPLRRSLLTCPTQHQARPRT